MRLALAIRLCVCAPTVRHAASSTALRAASSIVGSTWRFGGAASIKQLTALLRVRPVEPDDDRKLDRHLLERCENPPRHLVAARDPTEDVEEDRADIGVAHDHLERVDDTLRVASASEVAEVRRPAACEDDDVDGGHRQPSPLPRMPTEPSSLT